MSTAQDELRYTFDSVQLSDMVEELLRVKLKALVEKRVQAEGRQVITKEDIKACIPLAATEVLRCLEREGIIGSAAPQSDESESEPD